MRGNFVEEEQTIPLEHHREVSKIVAWNGRFGQVERADGDLLFLHFGEVIRGPLSELKVGNYVFHGVGISGEDRHGYDRWVAMNVELYSPEEQAEIQKKIQEQTKIQK